MTIRRSNRRLAVFVILASCLGQVPAYAQAPVNNANINRASDLPQTELDYGRLLPRKDATSFRPASLRAMPVNLLLDQRQIWSSPVRMQSRDADWLLPLSGFTAWLMATDRQFSTHLSNDPQTLKRYRQASNGGLGALIGAAGGLYVWGAFVHDDHRRETGLLGGEAALNTLAINTSIKYAAGRSRPMDDGNRGSFGRGGRSFPSDHAALAWSVASVLAHEYPGPLTKLLAYGAASAVSVSRVRAKEHFPSDVLIGSAIGWFIGEQIYRMRHHREYDPEHGLELGRSNDYSSSNTEATHSASSRPSTYVPLDSWVYPAIERLSGRGYVRTELQGMKPWTRTECARLVEEAREVFEERMQEDRPPDVLSIRLEEQLEQEFFFERNNSAGNRAARFHFDSIYGRVVSASGPILNDGFHFGQTVSYDSGRPFRRGTNGQLGMAASATAGSWLISVRAELQHSPAAPAFSDRVRSIIAERDFVAIQQPHIFGAVERVRLLDAYVGLHVKNWQITFGSQSLSWAPGAGGSLLISNNAEPLYMLRLTRVMPFELPSWLRFVGAVRVDQFVGRALGRSFVPHPLIYGQKISFRPNQYLEIGVARTTTLGGSGGDPFTTHNFFRSLVGLEGQPGAGLPGDSRSQVDWSFRVPGVRDYLVLYADAEADDDVLPYVAPSRAVWRPGIYLTRFPGLARVDLRVEATSSESPGFRRDRQGHLNYWHFIYRDGYTNNGVLMGNTVGREGKNVQVWSTYSISPLHQLKFGLKLSAVDPAFLPGGGAWRDYSVAHEINLHSGVYLKTFVQYEHIGHFPILFPATANNVTAWVEVGLSPGRQQK